MEGKTPVTPEWRPYSVPTALKKLQNAEVRAVQTPATPCKRCANAVQTLCNRLERNEAAFILSMLKTNAAAWRFHSVLDSTLWQRCGNAVGSFRAPWARCERAACTL